MDPISNFNPSNNNWYSLTSVSKGEEIAEYCEYCFTNFKKYNEMVQNICISCGRPAPQLIANPNERPILSGLNDDFDMTMMQGTSIEIDYTDVFKDESINGLHSNKGRMSANSATEAIQMIRDSEVTKRLVGGDSYKVKVKTGDNRKVRLDSNALEDNIR